MKYKLSYHRGVGWPFSFGRCSKHPKYLAQLVHFVLAREEGPSQEELREYASAAPKVDRSRIRRSQQDFGAPIPEGDDNGGEEGAEVIDAGEPEVGQLDTPLPRHQDVLRLQVPVDNSVAVKEVDPGEDLPHDVLDPVRGQARGRASLYVQVQVLNMIEQLMFTILILTQ